MARWVVQYIYEDKDGSARFLFGKIDAPTLKEAKRLANDRAPVDEFVFSVHPQSDAQFLDQVKSKAMDLAGKTEREIDG